MANEKDTKQPTAQAKEALRSLIRAWLYEEAFNILLDKYTANFLEKDFTNEVCYPSADYLRKSLTEDVLAKAQYNISKRIEEAFKTKSNCILNKRRKLWHNIYNQYQQINLL